MVPPNYIPWVVIAGTMLVAIAAPIFLGWDVIFVPFILIPFLILYFFVDRGLAEQEEDDGGGH